MQGGWGLGFMLEWKQEASKAIQIIYIHMNIYTGTILADSLSGVDEQISGIKLGSVGQPYWTNSCSAST